MRIAYENDFNPVAANFPNKRRLRNFNRLKSQK